LSIEIKYLQKDNKLDMRGGVIIDGFPSAGLINAIASECLIRSGGTELYAIIDSSDFPPLSIVSQYTPQFPARLHVNRNLKVAFFVSEFSIHPTIQGAIARTILNWSLENKCKMIISASGLVTNESHETTPGLGGQGKTDEQPIFGVASTRSGLGIIKEHGFVPLRAGSIRGIPAALLNEGSLVEHDVIVLLANIVTDAPDFRAAALISNALTKLVPGLSCDITALDREAQDIESKLKQIREDQHNMSSYIA
jgi:uncharacterized protein